MPLSGREPGPNVRAHGAAPERSTLAEARRLALPALAFAVYVGSIAGANWMIAHVGRTVPGAHELPVGFGLEAPSGVYLAGLTFVARDIVQRLAGTRAGVVAIVLGALVSWKVSSASLALASGGTFLLSESCDFAVYTPLQRRHFPLAVLGSGLVSDAVDSTVFLTLAGIPLSVALPGQLVGKAWLVLAGGLVAALLRRTGPFKSPQSPAQPPQAGTPQIAVPRTGSTQAGSAQAAGAQAGGTSRARIPRPPWAIKEALPGTLRPRGIARALAPPALRLNGPEP